MERGAEGHVPVLAEAALAWLAVHPDGTYVDCTAGAGGHACLIAAKLTAGRLVALDRDPAAVARAAERLQPYPCAEVHHANYGYLKDTLVALGVSQVDGILLDAGCSSMQLNESERGFSFQEAGPLDMRMDPTSGVSAAEYLSRVSEEELVTVLRQYGDVGPVRRIAKAILRRRLEKPFAQTSDLVEAVRAGLDFVTGMPDEVRTVFQAIRIAVNEELHWLQKGLREAMEVLKPGGRLVVIAFHSGEDRVVKDLFREASRPRRIFRPDGRVESTIQPILQLLTPKPVTPDTVEIRRNSRSKSAKLRAAERLPQAGG